MLSAVEDNRDIRQGLYPGTGANASSANGGGKPKTDFYWQLAVQLFADHEEYGTVIEEVRGSLMKKVWDPWVNKIKNQLNRFVHLKAHIIYPAYINVPPSMAEEVRKHSKTMGETGMGLESEKEIILGTPLARTWGEHVSTVWYTI